MEHAKLQQATKARDAAIIANFLPYIEAEIANLNNVANAKAYVLIAEGKMTPELALNLWYEKNAYYKLMNKLRKKHKLDVLTK